MLYLIKPEYARFSNIKVAYSENRTFGVSEHLGLLHKILPEKTQVILTRGFFSSGKVNGKNHANLSFQILLEFFSGKSFM